MEAERSPYNSNKDDSELFMSEGMSTLNIDKTKTPVKLFGTKNNNNSSN